MDSIDDKNNVCMYLRVLHLGSTKVTNSGQYKIQVSIDIAKKTKKKNHIPVLSCE